MQTILNNLVKRAGKPRSFWLLAASCVLGLVVGVHAVALQSLGAPRGLLLVTFWLAVGLWLTAAASAGMYFKGQLSGRYRDLAGRSWAELPW